MMNDDDDDGEGDYGYGRSVTMTMTMTTSSIYWRVWRQKRDGFEDTFRPRIFCVSVKFQPHCKLFHITKKLNPH